MQKLTDFQQALMDAADEWRYLSAKYQHEILKEPDSESKILEAKARFVELVRKAKEIDYWIEKAPEKLNEQTI